MRWRRTGSVLTVRRIIGDDRARFESYVNRSKGENFCHPWTASQTLDGYGHIRIGRQMKLSHVVAWEFENGPKPAEMNLDHECHNQAVREGTCRAGICMHRLCCNLSHLILKTPQQHKADTEKWDSRTRGSAHKLSVLTEDQVREIRRLIVGGKRGTQAQLARQYGVSESLIYAIKIRKAWGWLI